MDALGIICEYNPFHNGHIYQIQTARALTGADAVVCVMSGNFLQRGEVAVFDKWKRAEVALRNGADLVFEIPECFVLRSADVYASASVKMLESIDSVKYLCFGSESADISRLSLLADILNDRENELEEQIRYFAKKGYSYPRAREAALESLCPDVPAIGDDAPNDVLALEYLRAITRLTPVAIKREGAGYGSEINNSLKFQSGAGIRKSLLSGNRDYIKYVPQETAAILESEYNVINSRQDKLFDLLRYKLLNISVDEIDEMPQGGEGIGNKLIAAACESVSLDDMIGKVKSKRYTYTRISRLAMQILLNIKKDEYGIEPQYLRLLGFTHKGRKLLSEMKQNENMDTQVLTNINKDEHILNNTGIKQLELDIKSSDIYNLISGTNIRAQSDHTKMPVMI